MGAWAQLKNQIRVISGDEEAPYRVADEQLLDYANYGLDFVASRHPRRARATLTVTDQLAALPADYISGGQVFADGRELVESSSGFYPDGEEFVLVSDTELKVGDPDLAEVELLYQARYAHLTSERGTVSVPQRFEEALVYYAVARAIAQAAVRSGDISQWDTKNDSGNPEHNPLLVLADHYEAVATRILNRHPQ